jgi:hypothetical protein
MYEDRSYFIIPVTEIPNIDFDFVLETSAETLRISVDGTKTFVKWEGDAPPGFYVNMTGEGPYTHEEILEILSGEEWTETLEEVEN